MRDFGFESIFRGESLSASPLMKPFLTPKGWQLEKYHVLKCFGRFKMCFYIQYRFVCESFAFEKVCVKERNLSI